MEIARDPDLRSAAVASHQSAIFTKEHVKVRNSQEALWDDVCKEITGTVCSKLTPQLLRQIISVLRAAKYRSVMTIASVAKFRHIEEGYEWTQALDRQWRMSQRAVSRGLGPNAHAEPFPLSEAHHFAEEETPVVHNGPSWPRRTIVIGCWWLLREIELGNASALDVTANADGSVALLLLLP